VRRGASWTAAYHRQLTVAAVARPVRGSVGPSASLLAERSWWLLAQTTLACPDDVGPEQCPGGIDRSGVVAVVDPASSQATASAADVQQAVSTHPGSVSGIRLSSRPVSGHLGSSSSGSGARPSAVHPSGVGPAGVQPSGVGPVGPDASVSSMLRRWRWEPGSRWPGDPDHQNRWRPGGWRAVDGSTDGRRGREAGDATGVGLVRGR
jgi:hypothetical protein